jgi:CRP/FNR family transcriptional regulator
MTHIKVSAPRLRQNAFEAPDFLEGARVLQGDAAMSGAAPDLPGSMQSHAEHAAYHSSRCEACSLKSGCLPRALRASELSAFAEMARHKRKIQGGTRLFSAGSVFASIYVVRSGTFKTVTVSHEGTPKIMGFYLPGDLIGLDAVADGVYGSDGIALEDSEVCVLPINSLLSLASAFPDLLKEFVRVLSAEITRDHRLSTLLASMDAEQRVARFLLDLTERYHRLGYARDALFLHMTRNDIASYLGLSSETVSRIMTRLQRRGLVTVHQRHIDLDDCGRLTQAADW